MKESKTFWTSPHPWLALALCLACLGLPATPARADVWLVETVDDLASYAYGTSLALDDNGYPHVAYYDLNLGDLKYAYKDAGGWHPETVDSDGLVGQYPSIALTSDGSPRIAYFDKSNGDIKYAYRDAGGWHPEFVADAGSYGGHVSLALDSSGVPHISYFESVSGYRVKYATKNGGGWTPELIKVVSGFGGHTSIAVDSSEQPHVVFTDSLNILHSYRDGGGWHSEQAVTIGWFGGFLSLALDSSDHAHISFYDDNGSALKYVYTDGSQWFPQTVTTPISEDSGYSSIALDSADHPRIAFFDDSGDTVRLASSDGSGWQFDTVAVVGDLGGYVSLELDDSHQPHISYGDASATSVKYAYRTAGPPPTARYVDGSTGLAAPAAACNGLTPCYPTITAAVAASNSGDTIYVFPGTYAESVNLSSMALPGSITLATVDASAVPTPGTATVSPASGSAFYTSPALTGEVSLGGFVVASPDADAIFVTVNSDVVIDHVTANGAADDGVDIVANGGDIFVSDSVASGNLGATDGDGFDLDALAGNVSIDNCTANGNSDEGFDVDASGLVTVEGSIANGNGDDGFDLETTGGVAVTNSTADSNLDAEDGDGFDIEAGGSVALTGTSADGNAQEGIDVQYAGGNVTYSACTVDGNGGEGLDVDEVGGALLIDDCRASNNGGDGLQTGEVGIAGTLQVRDSTFSGNSYNGVFVIEQSGSVTVTRSVAINNGGGHDYPDGFKLESNLGSVTVISCTANYNIGSLDNDGIEIGPVAGNILARNVTVIGNSEDGLDLWDTNGAVAVEDCVSRDNGDDGVWLGGHVSSPLVRGTITCNNSTGVALNYATTANAESNWWGCAAGPGNPGCNIADNLQGTIDVEPWIDTISATATVDPVNAGEPSIIRFQFSGGSGTVFLGQGPGDLNGTPPFRLSTSNGKLTDSDETGPTVYEFVNLPNGILEVTLIPTWGGTTTVTLDGPCGLDSSIVVQAIGETPRRLYLPLVLRQYAP